MTRRLATSELLDALLTGAPSDRVTLGWLMASLGDRSFGIVMLVLGLLALLPGASAVVAIVLTIPAFQMIRARRGPVIPSALASRPFPTHALGSVLRITVPVLRFLERFIGPRWPMPFETTKRIVGAVILSLAGLLLAPVPLSNVPPALVIAAIAVAYLEEDGVLLCSTLAAAALLLAFAVGAAWEALSATGWVSGFF